jgi:hypothetical protein
MMLIHQAKAGKPAIYSLTNLVTSRKLDSLAHFVIFVISFSHFEYLLGIIQV